MDREVVGIEGVVICAAIFGHVLIFYLFCPSARLSFLKAITKRWHASVSSVLVNTLWRGSVVLAGTIFIEAMQQI
jgi:hypothetical protein